MKNYIHITRHQLGLSQKDLAKMVGISTTTLSLIELGKSIPSVEKALKIAYYLEVDINQIFKLELS